MKCCFFFIYKEKQIGKFVLHKSWHDLLNTFIASCLMSGAFIPNSCYLNPIAQHDIICCTFLVLWIVALAVMLHQGFCIFKQVINFCKRYIAWICQLSAEWMSFHVFLGFFFNFVLFSHRKPRENKTKCWMGNLRWFIIISDKHCVPEAVWNSFCLSCLQWL